MQAEAKKLDDQLLDPKWTPLQRVLLGRTKKGDVPAKFNDPQVIQEWIQTCAREGPKLLTSTHIERAKPVVVTVTGGAGSIAYSMVTRILNGEMLGPNQPIILKLLDLPQAKNALDGVAMEIEDMAFPLLEKLVATTDEKEAFSNCDFALLVGAKPRTKGMARGDLCVENAPIFASQGKALNKYASPEVHVLVVGNPANTNAMLVSVNAPDIPRDRISALTRLDHDRGLSVIAQKVGCRVDDVHRFCIWGNHSEKQYPDISHVVIGEGKGTWARKIIDDAEWCDQVFVQQVAQRGKQIIDIMGKSSAASAADASIKHMRDWICGNKEWLSMAIPSDGSYGVPRGIWSSFPVYCNGGGEVAVISGLPVSEFSATKIAESVAELFSEKKAVEHLIPANKFHFIDVDAKKVYDPDFLLFSSSKSKRKEPVVVYPQGQ